MRSAYNILLYTVFLFGITLMFVRRVRRHSAESGLRAAVFEAILTAGRVLGWVFTIAVAPIFLIALFSVGATLVAIVLIVVDLGLIGILITSGKGLKNEKRDYSRHPR